MRINRNDEFIDFFTPLLREAKINSKESDLHWIIFILTVIENRKTPKEFHVPGFMKNNESYVYNEYSNKGGYVILYGGEEISKVGWPK